MSSELSALVADGLVDHHCHGVVNHDLERGDFELLMTESDHPAAAGTDHFATPLGTSIRRYCAPVLDLEPGVSADVYLARRTELGAEECNRRLLRASGIDVLLLETGYRSDDILSPSEMSTLAAATAYEVVRIERVAEEVVDDGITPEDFADAFERRLRDRAADAVGLKSIVAYRHGFRIDHHRPTPDEVRAATERWLRQPGPARLEDPTLLRFALTVGFEVAREFSFPIQFHVGFGDADISMTDNDPTLLRDWLEQARTWGVDVTLLHCYPYHRQAGWLAAIYPNVYVDVGLTLNYVGPAAPRIFAEACELTPTTKHLFSSDAFGLPELYYLGARRYREALVDLLDDLLARGEYTDDDARVLAEAIGGGNARRIYPLERARAH